MNNSSKVWFVQDMGENTPDMLLRADTWEEATEKAFRERYERLGSDRWDLTAARIPWLEEFPDLFGPDALMARLRHKWEIPWPAAKGVGVIAEAKEGDLIGNWEMEHYATCHGLPVETVYWMFAELIGATYPDKYRPERAKGQMWVVHDRTRVESEGLLVWAASANEATETAYGSVYEHLDRNMWDLQAVRAPWAADCPNLSVLDRSAGPDPAPGGGGTGNSREGAKEPRTEQTKEEA